MRTKDGRDKDYETPEILWKEIAGYFEWCEENPWYKNEAVKGGDLAGQLIQVPTARPFTIGGLCVYLGICLVTWKEYCKREGFTNITTHAEEVIRTQKFEGAAVGAFNANIIARDLGLVDRKDHTSDGQAMDFIGWLKATSAPEPPTDPQPEPKPAPRKKKPVPVKQTMKKGNGRKPSKKKV